MTQTDFKLDDAKVSVYLDAPNWSQDTAAAFGQFSCKNFDAGTAIIAQAIDFVKTKGIKRIIGPLDGDTWHGYRFVTKTDGSPAFMLEPSNTDVANDVFRHAGFTPISRYFSARVPLTETGQFVPPDSPNLRIETWDGADPEELFKQVYDLSVAAFQKNAFFKPISFSDFLKMYMPIVPLLKKELVFFARTTDGKLAGFLFAIPNYNEGPMSKTAILKTYASLQKGAGQMLAYAFHTTARDLGYETAIHALIHDDNLSAVRSAAEGAEIFRRYALFGLKLDG